VAAQTSAATDSGAAEASSGWGNREGMVEFISGGGDDGDRRDDSVGMRRLDDLTEVI